eukprot:1533291-Pleurochrysis_carterae.AAC.1
MLRAALRPRAPAVARRSLRGVRRAPRAAGPLPLPCCAGDAAAGGRPVAPTRGPCRAPPASPPPRLEVPGP